MEELDKEIEGKPFVGKSMNILCLASTNLSDKAVYRTLSLTKI
jgi:hypothetical protein